MRLFVNLVLAAIVLSMPQAADAQSFLAYLDGGLQNVTFGSGLVEKQAAAIGGGIGVTIQGSSSQDFGFSMPVMVDFRSDTGFDSGAMVVSSDLAFRIKSFSFGPGANYGLMLRPDLDDPTCRRPLPNNTSCRDVGVRYLGNMQGIGFSGFAKISFGPQGRAFVQYRHIEYVPGWMNFDGDFVDGASGQPIATDAPPFDSGRDWRVSAGYVFGGAGKAAKILRVQYMDRRLDFGSSVGNRTGIFDEESRQLTVGIGVLF